MSADKVDVINTDTPTVQLSALIAKYMAMVLIGGMAVYGTIEYFILPDITFMHLILEHLGHVVFLMILVYITLYYVLLKSVVEPIRRFSAKLYRVAGGELTPISEPSKIKEISDMAGGINLMIDRLSGGLPGASLGELFFLVNRCLKSKCI